ncbi:ATP-binding protein [Streptomyces sp. TS71-3]|uniref:ATP-binding protein n=1 Tax=Streptomyces sp. TS71-3 TaxID=2733862 RepID=UPI001B01DCC1|nr:ATP-binding protein [Streptomyces sp. TS71-3]GHJ35042.1 hypothetical protein Sm713_06510 [Streptomyces sp. TS71-3]
MPLVPTPSSDPESLPYDAEWYFTRRPRSVGRARALLREEAAAWKLPEELTETAVLLLSELMTNAYRHAKVSPGREIRTRLYLSEETLRVEVADADRTLPRAHDSGPEDESGRGLELVAALAERWGAEHRACGIGKRVWFELRR